MTDDLPLDADDEVDAFQNLLAGDVFRDSTGREFEILDINYMFELVKVVYLDTEDDVSIRFADWLASPPTLVKEGEWPQTNVVLGEPEHDEPQTDEDWSDEDDEDDEELMLEQVRGMARRVADSAYDRYRTMGYDSDQARARANKDAADLVNNYAIQRMARR